MQLSLSVFFQATFQFENHEVMKQMMPRLNKTLGWLEMHPLVQWIGQL